MSNPNYALISYTPAPDKESVGQAVIKVTGCVLQTEVDIPYGSVAYDAKWNATVDPVIAAVQANMDPNSPTYDPTLTGG